MGRIETFIAGEDIREGSFVIIKNDGKIYNYEENKMKKTTVTEEYKPNRISFMFGYKRSEKKPNDVFETYNFQTGIESDVMVNESEDDCYKRINKFVMNKINENIDTFKCKNNPKTIEKPKPEVKKPLVNHAEKHIPHPEEMKQVDGDIQCIICGAKLKKYGKIYYCPNWTEQDNSHSVKCGVCDSFMNLKQFQNGTVIYECPNIKDKSTDHRIIKLETLIKALGYANKDKPINTNENVNHGFNKDEEIPF